MRANDSIGLPQACRTRRRCVSGLSRPRDVGTAREASSTSFRRLASAVYWMGAVRVSREGVDVGQAYLELTGYADALRMGRE
ncbi:lipocalin family protein, partial [Paraburkholderia sediminicola]|uniref:lipocalin family protein n=1 Tax=Paraburkholderia sediminicola TaxID=458836 RepID=UPI0038BA03A7